MKLEPDCVRDVLLEIEAAGLYDTITDETLAVKLPKWSKDAITYTCQMLKSADYIDVEVKHYIRGPEIRGRGMTYKGVEFLEQIRDDGLWQKIKKKASSCTIHALAIAAKVVLEESIKALF